MTFVVRLASGFVPAVGDEASVDALAVLHPWACAASSGRTVVVAQVMRGKAVVRARG